MKFTRFDSRLAAAILALILTAVPSRAKSNGTPAHGAFARLRSLVGQWVGTDDQGQRVKTQFTPIAASTAIMETLSEPGMDEMATIYSLDVDGIALTHYCPTNNQPRMRAVPASGDVKMLVFSFTGAGNLPNPSIGHEWRLVLTFDDRNHITEAWTWRSGGKDTVHVFHFRRIAANR